MKTLKEAKELAIKLMAKNKSQFPNIVFWIEKEHGEFTVMHNLSGKITNPLKKKQWYLA